MKRVLSFCALMIWSASLMAQSVVTGTIKSESGEPLAGVNVQEKNTLNGTVSDVRGGFKLRVHSATGTLVFTLVGYEKQTIALDGKTEIEVTMKEGSIEFGEFQVVGTRSYERTVTATPVPVDIIDMRDITMRSGSVEINSVLQNIAPSFNSNKQSGADGADHVDPATLRGLGPDQTLVLLNGKRYHQSSLVNIFGSRGRGNTGTDLNTIPSAAIERIEILRDGASAQYGSDAIAGVMNIVMKKSVGEFTGSVTYGANNADPGDKPHAKSNGNWDGNMMNVNANYGFGLGEQGFVNVTGDFVTRDKTNRPANPSQYDIYRKQYGDASGNNYSFFVNSAYPLGKDMSVYMFGGYNFRYSDAYAWTRDPGSERNVVAIYPNGFDPRITADINDLSATVGMRYKFDDLDIDFSNTYGGNKFSYNIKHTLNATLEAASPTSFDAGGFSLYQNTTGINVSTRVAGFGEGLNLAAGLEFRVDNYEIFAGEEGSWQSYGKILFDVVDGDSIFRPAGAQGFPGFRPSDEINKSRTNLAFYGEAEYDVTKSFLVTTALRFEDYSDFGNTFTGKIASRYKLSNELTLRGSTSTGFRAPSLPQIYFNSTFTDFVAGQAVDKVIARNNSAVAKALGIPKLKEEKATDISGGFTFENTQFSFSADMYHVVIKDRIVLTGAFEDSTALTPLNVGAAQFFTNAIDTRTTGLDLVVSNTMEFAVGRLKTTFAANFNKMRLSAVHTNSQLAGQEDTYFSSREKRFLLASAPESKMNLTFDHQYDQLNSNLQFVRYGKVELENWDGNLDVYKPKIVVNLTETYNVTDHIAITAGVLNLFNTYPDRKDPALTESGGLWDSVQMGFSGAFVFSKLMYRF